MRLYYKVADYLIAVEGSGVSAMENLQGFSAFKTDHCQSDSILINLEETEPKTAEGNIYYKSCTGNTVCLMFKSSNGYGLEIRQNDILQLVMSYDRSKPKCDITGNLIPVFLRYALWIAFNLGALRYRGVAIHSSSVIYQGKALLCLGESGTGKSTHTRLICQKFPDAELLNDDSPILRMERGRCMVYGSPWSGKTACYHDWKAELGSVVRLHQATENKISLLSLHRAIGALLPSFPPELYLCSDFYPVISDFISGIVEQASVCFLDCLPNEAAAELSVRTLAVSFHNGGDR